MQKDASYHKSAIEYNEEIAEFTEKLAERLEHEEVQRWSRSVARQHRFHAGRHQKALDKLQSSSAETVNTEDGGEDRVVEDERVVHKSSVDGEFVSEAEAQENPDTTYETTVDVPPPAAQPVEDGPDMSQTPQPVSDGATAAGADVIGEENMPANEPSGEES